jgi:hypothetical protein
MLNGYLSFGSSIITLLLGLGFFVMAHTALAANFTVSPLLLDYNAEARDIINRDIILTNTTDKPIRAYASVHEVVMGEGTEIKEFVPASMSESRATSITSWLEISRARLEIPPNGTLSVPLTIRINPETPPGTYHAIVGFAAGRNRDEIESQVMRGDGVSAILKIVVDDTRQEQLHLVNFITKRFVVLPNDNTLSFTLENTGDIPLTPAGEVIIYDTTGREVASVTANSAGETVLPGERLVVTEPLPYTARVGRNKAYLSLEYGANRATVFDTAFYYSVPWYYLFGLVLVLTFILFLLIWIFKRAFAGDGYDQVDSVYEVPLFYRNAHDHEEHDHDLDLKNNAKNS